jgi:uncharacterized protein
MNNSKNNIDAFTKTDRKDMADKEAVEITVQQGYQPVNITSDEVLVAAKAIDASISASDSGG